ncbi:MAG: zinc-binding dehydrogenase [Anaerolineae bacterium]|nr:zinc-binding dehydrogenase [Anaerolineae bacterium]
MKAVVLYRQEAGCVDLREMPRPTIGPDQVLVQVECCGICGSEIHIYHNQVSYRLSPPLILGHEFAGVIVEKGAEVRGFDLGERVTAETHAYTCGRCRLCRSGEYNLCPERRSFGFTADGAFARYVAVRQQILHHVPEKVPLPEAALTEPLCVAYNALVEKSRLRPGDLVAILGPGPIGLFCVQVARLLGAGTVVVAGIGQDRERLELARQLGADVTVNAAEADPVECVLDLSRGAGADLVVDAAGPATTLRQSLAMVRRNGQVTKIGWGPEPVGFSLDPIIEKVITLQGAFSHTWPTWERVLGLMAQGRLRTAPLISARLPISRWREGFEAVERGTAVKVILDPEE